MALITSQMVAREGLAILHEKLDFVNSVNRQYDNSFGATGAKNGTSLKIRLPNEYVIREGASYVDQGHEEIAETLVVATQLGVDSSISDIDLAMSMDDFKSRILEPQMAVLASIIESRSLQMSLDVANTVGTPGTTPGSTANQALLPWLQAKQRLSENLAPGPYRAQIDGNAATYTINGLSGLFNDQRTLAKQFTEGFLLRNSGVDYMQNNRIIRLTCGTRTNGTVNGDKQGEDGTMILAGVGAAGTIKKGEIFTIGSVYDIHPETKQSYGRLKQFVVTADATADGTGAVTISMAPTIVTSGARQNVDAAAITGATVTFAGTASTAYPINLIYERDAFAFVAADLERPKDKDECYVANIDKLPMRYMRWFDGDAGKWKSRFDVVIGYKTLDQRRACRCWG